MQYRPLFLMATLGVAMVFATACGNASQQATPPSKVPANAQKVTVTASNFQWALKQTTFKASQPIDFEVSSKQGTHGFAIVGTNVRQTITQGSSPQNVVWAPPSPGDYTIRCDIYCGSGHPNMFTTIHVGS